MNKDFYTIYSKPNCPYCVRAESMLKMKGLPYEKLMLDVDFTRDELLELMIVPQKTFPYITHTVGGEVQNIGGCDDLIKHLVK